MMVFVEPAVVAWFQGVPRFASLRMLAGRGGRGSVDLVSAERRKHDLVTKELDVEPSRPVDFEAMANAGFDDACKPRGEHRRQPGLTEDLILNSPRGHRDSRPDPRFGDMVAEQGFGHRMFGELDAAKVGNRGGW